MQLLLLRHGESLYNAEGRIQGWADPPLSERGREQAQALAWRLQGRFALAALYASPLQRAAQTTAIIGQRLNMSPILDERLKEWGVGVLTGLTHAEVQERYPEISASWRQSPERTVFPGQEELALCELRTVAVMNEIVARHAPNETVGIVGHGGTLGLYLCHLVGLPTTKRSPFHLGNASLSIVRLEGVRHTITLLNGCGHLETGPLQAGPSAVSQPEEEQ